MLFFVLHTLLRASRSIFLCVSRGSQAVCVEQSAGTVRCRRRIIELAKDSASDSEFNEIPTGGKIREARAEFDKLWLDK